MRDELKHMLSGIAGMTPEQLPELLGELEVVRATALLRMSAPVPARAHDELLTADEAADRLGISKNTLYRNSSSYPFTRRIGKGRNLRFSALGIDAYLAKRR
jgi:predicted DNA-binding transcriptional regulator AlpA